MKLYEYDTFNNILFFLTGYLSQKFGRKAILLYLSVPYVLGWLIIAYAPNIGSVYAGRALCGLCMGICFAAVPAYVVEVASLHQRGQLSTGFQLAFASGVFLVMLLGNFLRWSWLAVAGAALIAAGALLLLYMPESPQWLVAKSMHKEALLELEFLRSDSDVATKELQEIIDDQKTEGEHQELTVNELFNDPALYKPLVIAVALMFFQQACGVNPLMSYAVELFQNSSATFAVDASWSSAIVALVQVLGTGVSGLLMDRVGRRILYVFSGFSMTLSHIGSGCYSYFFQQGSSSEMGTAWNWVPLASFAVFILSFSLGFGPVPMVVAPELIPTRNRSFLLAVASVSSSIFGFLFTKTFDDLRSVAGLYGTYWIFAGLSFLGSVFYWFFVSETKGKTIREINRTFSRSFSSQQRELVI